MSADLELEAVYTAGFSHAGVAQVGDQVIDVALRSRQQRVARQPQERTAERRVPQRHQPRARSRHVEAGQRALEQLRRAPERAADDDDLARLHPSLQRHEHLGGDELCLRTLAAGLHQRHRVAGFDRQRIRLEQMAFEVMQCRARAARVVLVERRQLRHRLRERSQLLHDSGARGERRPVGLVGERNRDLDTDRPGERLDRVELDRSQIVEAVKEYRRRSPAQRRLAQRIERAPRERLGIGAIETVELVGVASVDRGEVAHVCDTPTRVAGPAPQRRAEPSRIHPHLFELGDQPSGSAAETAAGGRVRESVETQRGDRASQYTVTLQRRQLRAAIAGA